MDSEEKGMEWIHTQLLLLKSGAISFEEWLITMVTWANEQESKAKQ